MRRGSQVGERRRDLPSFDAQLSEENSRAKTEGRSCRECDANLDVRHLARHEFSTHIRYLARHCRRNTAGSLPRGMPTVVDESVEVRER
jgi:hypothetical protein